MTEELNIYLMCLGVLNVSNTKKENWNLASGLSLKSYGPPPHSVTFRGSGWEYMVQVEAPSTTERREGVPSPGGQHEEEHWIVLQVQRRSPKTKNQSPKFLGLSLSTTSLVEQINIVLGGL